jgi:uncharacterized repeat protein (TIGR03847 family)
VPNQSLDLKPVDRITAGAIGEPGKREFYIQARKGRRLVTLKCEKEHVLALALAIDQFLLSLAENDPDTVAAAGPAIQGDMALEVPLEPLFHAGEVGLGYDQVGERVVVILHEQLEEGEAEEGVRPSVVRFWATPAQMRAFCLHAQEVVAGGRPRCSMCGEPIEPEGHFCPRKNGDRTHD